MGIAPLQTQLSFVFRGFCLFLPPLGVLAQRGVVPLLMIAAALACLLVWRAERRLPLPDRALSLAFAALVIWCAVASFWGFDVARSLVLTLRIGAIFAAGLMTFAIVRYLDAEVRDGLGAWLLAGILIALAAVAVEIAFDYPINELATGLSSDQKDLRFRLNRGATAMAMMVWPAVALLWRRGVAWGALVLLAVVAVALNLMTSGAAILGAAAGGATAALALSHRKAGHLILVFATLLALVGSAPAAKEIQRRGWKEAEWLVTSARHRVDIWSYAAERIEQKPLTGWGFDSARGFTKFDPSRNIESWQMVPLHPHNAPLQILLELGAVGGFIAFVLLMVVVNRLEELPRPARVCGQALYMSTLAIACTAYGLWQNQWLAMMCSAALLVPLTTPALAKPAAPPQAPGEAAESPSPGARQ
jgi:O-antigen ligase